MNLCVTVSLFVSTYASLFCVCSSAIISLCALCVYLQSVVVVVYGSSGSYGCVVVTAYQVHYLLNGKYEQSFQILYINEHKIIRETKPIKFTKLKNFHGKILIVNPKLDMPKPNERHTKTNLTMSRRQII